MTTNDTPASHLAEINANCDAYESNAITWQEWNDTQFALWDAIHAKGHTFADNVRALWRAGASQA